MPRGGALGVSLEGGGLPWLHDSEEGGQRGSKPRLYADKKWVQFDDWISPQCLSRKT